MLDEIKENGEMIFGETIGGLAAAKLVGGFYVIDAIPYSALLETTKNFYPL